MSKELWSYWVPANIEQSDYNIDSLCENGLNFIIILINYEKKDHEMHITFKKARCFRRTNELYTVARMRMAYQQQTREFFLKRQSYKIINSEYLQWASQQSDGISDSAQLEHYVVFTDDIVLDILCANEPAITFVDRNQSHA